MLGWREDELWILSCSEAALLLGDSPFVPMLGEAARTLFNEYILPLLNGEHTALSCLTKAGVDLGTEMTSHMWEMDLDTCGISMA